MSLGSRGPVSPDQTTRSRRLVAGRYVEQCHRTRKHPGEFDSAMVVQNSQGSSIGDLGHSVESEPDHLDEVLDGYRGPS